ncbi:hypothetical protein [Tabrizicola sp. YIM 78059]|uniref:hypothetical protein n=1 Tax=Tabrizicola sp. YIM 78059 TaxID=2529861 RepID=UPI0010A9F681|nr:hypothetical protein [Tabrizicola sp. YIM 78059]
MNRYEGLVGKPDKIVGGGKWVTENESGHEVCNFLPCPDGFVYGHVETVHGENDRQIRLERLGGTGNSLDGIDVIWTATHPDERGRRVVGWYRNATVFRERQDFEAFPSKQHKRDDIRNYRIRALASDAHRLDLEDRSLAMGRGKGWMGHTPWWSPDDSSPQEVQLFLQHTRALIESAATADPGGQSGGTNNSKSTGAAGNPYVRYVQTYEACITPRHSELQGRFERFLSCKGATELRPNLASVDLRYSDSARGQVLAEIKPCETESSRYAIRTAMGQLLDYRQRANGDVSLLIVVEVKPSDEDLALATSNGFGIAFPSKDAFKIIWPKAWPPS